MVTKKKKIIKKTKKPTELTEKYFRDAEFLRTERMRMELERSKLHLNSFQFRMNQKTIYRFEKAKNARFLMGAGIAAFLLGMLFYRLSFIFLGVFWVFFGGWMLIKE